MTALAALYVSKTLESRSRQEFASEVHRITEKVQARLESYIALLRGGAGLLAANPNLNREQFHRYAARLRLDFFYPGIQGVGFTRRIPAAERTNVISWMWQQGVTNFHIWPDYPRDEYHSIVFLEPLDRRNQRAIGFDMFSEPVRRAAMERSRDQGVASASGKVTLVQETEDSPKQAGFLLYIPVYSGGAVPPAVEQRQAELIGFSYSPFRAGDLFKGIVPDETTLAVRFEIFDGTEPNETNLLHRSFIPNQPGQISHMQIRESLQVAGRTWTIVAYANPALANPNPSFVPLVVISGALLSFLFFFLTSAEAMARERAERQSQERLRAEATLREREAFYRKSKDQLQLITDAVPVLIGYVDAEQRYQFNNRAYESWFAIPRDEIVGRHIREVVGESIYASFRPYLEKALQGEMVSFECEINHPAFGSKFVQTTYVPDIQNGKTAGVVVLVADISQRRHSEQSWQFLVEAGKQLGESLDYRVTLSKVAKLAVPRVGDWCAIHLLGGSGEIELVELVHPDPAKRKAVSEMLKRWPVSLGENFGLAKVLTTGQTVFLPEITDQALLTAARGGQPHFDILRTLGLKSAISVAIRGRGKIFGALTFLTSESNRRYDREDAAFAEELGLLAGMSVDNAFLFQAAQTELAERKQTEEALRQSEERFRLVLEQAKDYAIFLLDIEGRISSWNLGAERILGYTDEEIIGQKGDILFTPEDRAAGAPAQELSEAVATGQAADERWHLRKLGERFWSNGTMIALRDTEGKLLGFAKIMRDMTHQKKAEEAIRQANLDLEARVGERTAALHESHEQMEAFTYTVAHDLRAPLRAMQGFSQALKEDYTDRLDATGRDFLERIVHAAQRMDSLIQDLLAYSRLSRSDLSFDPINLNIVLESVLSSLEHDIQNRRAELTVAEKMPGIIGHRATLEHMLANLISNAMKFVAHGITPKIRIWAERKKDRVRLWIEDNGIGIDLKHQERIFKVFERLHPAEKYPGTGIGLAIVRKGAERMGGEVGVESAVGHGSRFWIELPADLKGGEA